MNSGFLNEFAFLRFAEALLNLKGQRGFEYYLARVSPKQLGRLEAELWPASILVSKGIEIEFVHEGTETSPDVLLWGEAATPVAQAEFKNKVPKRVAQSKEAKAKNTTATRYSRDTLVTSLKKARKKKKFDLPRIIFLRVPTEWAMLSTFKADVAWAFEYICRNSKSVCLLVVHWEALFGGSIMATLHFTRVNPNFDRWSDTLKDYVMRLQRRENDVSYLTLDQLYDLVTHPGAVTKALATAPL